VVVKEGGGEGARGRRSVETTRFKKLPRVDMLTGEIGGQKMMKYSKVVTVEKLAPFPLTKLGIKTEGKGRREGGRVGGSRKQARRRVSLKNTYIMPVRLAFFPPPPRLPRKKEIGRGKTAAAAAAAAWAATSCAASVGLQVFSSP